MSFEATQFHGPSALLTDHLPMAEQLAARLRRRYTWVRQDDLHSYALLGLSMAAEAFDPDRNVPFAKYASHKAFFWAVDEMRRDGLVRRKTAKPLPKTFSLGTLADSDGTSVPDPPDARAGLAQTRLEARDFCAVLLRRLPERDRKILLLHYADQMTFREVGRVLGVSESAICLRHKALMGKLRRLANARTLS